MNNGLLNNVAYFNHASMSTQLVPRSITFRDGSGCGSIGRAVAFGTRGLRFESSHR